MATEYQLSYTAEEIDERLGMVGTLSEEIADYRVPQAVIDGASDLVDKALSRGNKNVLRFIISADAHQKNDDELITKGTKELGQAHGEVLKLIGVDFVANLGDITWGSSASDNATVLEEGKVFNSYMLGNIRGETQIWTEGNHETDKLTDLQIGALIYSHNKGLIQDADHWIEGYGYMDFPNQKVRVICLNTDQQTGNDASGVSDAQVKWFAETALNMEGKTDWHVITMGHHPISYNNVSLMKYCAYAVEAFTDGANFSLITNSGTEIAIDYREKACQYIGHFHGHAHAFSVVRMQKFVSSGNYEEVDAWEICIPNACYSRNNQYLNNGLYTARYSTETTYNKSDADGQRTSFNLVTIDLDNKMIYADNYGAGIDRAVSYHITDTTYSVTNILTNCSTNNSMTFVGKGGTYAATITPANGYILDAVSVLMGGVDITSTVYADGVINIESVTGNIVITATAIEKPAVNLLNMAERTYVALTEPQFIATTEAREMDYTKCYAMTYDYRRGSYPTGKITKCELDVSANGFTYKNSSTSGYGLEFPVQLEGGKTYELKCTSEGHDSGVYLVKYNADTTVSGGTEIHMQMAVVSTYSVTITAEEGYLYSLFFNIKNKANTDITLKNISLLEQ